VLEVGALMPPLVAAALFVAALPWLAPLVAAAVKKKELMQEDWQDAYCSVSPAVPFPCGHCAAHSVVAFALAWFGPGVFLMSPPHDLVICVTYRALSRMPPGSRCPFEHMRRGKSARETEKQKSMWSER
jgi:hypothetical protein